MKPIRIIGFFAIVFVAAFFYFRFSHATKSYPETSSKVTKASSGFIKPEGNSSCPVCGMFVKDYESWWAALRSPSGKLLYFDGARDMFRYWLDWEKFQKSKKRKDVSEIFVTEYYDLKIIDAKSAYFVTGSDVLGPMGHELIPFDSEEAAKEFKEEHSGKAIFSFSEVSLALLVKLEKGQP